MSILKLFKRYRKLARFFLFAFGTTFNRFLQRCYKVGAAACRDPNFVNFTSTVIKNIDEAQSLHLFYVYLLAIDNQDACRASWHTYAGNVIDGVGSAVVVYFDTVDACFQICAAADVTFAI